ncbi:hypothetical protein [Nocardia camponoti]|uniref:Uncharacterized protein n=1 Tax=Nocardia camponoti TaxID=1616106 RepID=A0A917QKY5_9NOCA|nr:hypothetical protein [Nocardia camponoti]GGK54876.1 hypothetical protein GCM10011591_28450 [Nocardia camponoti]
MSIDWDTIGQEHFDRIVEALINHKYRGDGVAVLAVDGRGGDGGVDIEVHQDGRVIIFQLKYFPEGFSGGWAPRRKQIKRSFDKLVKSRTVDKTCTVDEWVLVVPRNLTPGENTFVTGLGKTSTTPPTRAMGRKDLDDLLIEFPTIDRWAQRNVHSELRDNAAIYNRERDNLLNPDDLPARVAALGSVVDSTDQDWTFDFARHGDTVTQVLRAQHPNAAQVNPVHFHVRGKFGPEHTELAAQFKRRIRFGTGERLVLPPQVVTEVDITGPDHIARHFDSSQVVIDVGSEAPGVGRRIELRLSDENGKPVTSHEGVIAHLGTGTSGLSIESKFYDGRLATRIMFPIGKQSDVETTLQTSRNIGGAQPWQARNVLHLVRQLRTLPKIEVFIEDTFLLSMNNPGNETDLDDLILEEFADDLDILQRHCDKYFALPAVISPMDRISVRVARIILEGGMVAAPHSATVTGYLSGEDSPELRAALTGPNPVLIEFDNYALTLAGRELSIGPVWVFHQATTVVDSDAAIAALESGTQAPVEFEPGSDPFFFLASTSVPADQIYSKPQTLWQLSGITQPPQDAPHVALAATPPADTPPAAITRDSNDPGHDECQP